MQLSFNDYPHPTDKMHHCTCVSVCMCVCAGIPTDADNYVWICLFTCSNRLSLWKCLSVYGIRPSNMEWRPSNDINCSGVWDFKTWDRTA